MRATLFFTAFLFSSTNLLAELSSIGDENLAKISAQSRGLTINVDVSDVKFSYGFRNNQNPNENRWVIGSGTGSGSASVGGLGSGDGLIQFNGISVDVGVLPDNAAVNALIIGLPEEVRLNRVNTGDYYIANPNDADPDAPPASVDTSTDRKLIGLKWNTPPPLNLGAAGSDVTNYDFTPHAIEMRGQVYVFGN